MTLSIEIHVIAFPESSAVHLAYITAKEVLLEALNLNVVSVSKYEPPASAYDSLRNQFNAETLLLHAHARRSCRECILLCICDLDGYVPGLNFVFGLAIPALQCCAVFITRLKTANTKLFVDRCRKEILHEIGHVLGLEHCHVRGCVMNFSNSLLEVDEKSWKFCLYCAEKLRRRGVKINPSYVLHSHTLT